MRVVRIRGEVGGMVGWRVRWVSSRVGIFSVWCMFWGELKCEAWMGFGKEVLEFIPLLGLPEEVRQRDFHVTKSPSSSGWVQKSMGG